MSLVTTFLVLVQPLGAVMTVPTFANLLVLWAGWIFARRRTITGMLVSAGVAGTRHHSAFHRVFAAARWSLDRLGLAVFELILPWVTPGVIRLSLDDTLARKRGLKVYGVGMHHDPLLSSRKLAVTSWGHSWVVLAVVVRLPFCKDRVFSLPVLFRLYLNHKAATRWKATHRSRPELAVQLLELLCPRYPNRRFHLVADTTYGGQSVLVHLPHNCDLTSRLPLNARLYQAPSPRQPGQKGRPRKRGPRLPTPQQMLRQRATHVTLQIYGRRDKVRLVHCQARWHDVPDRALQVVVVEPLTGGRPPQAFYCTQADMPAVEVLTGYAERWSIEEANQGSKVHLGFEEPQGWSRLAVKRTAPMAMLLYSLIVLWFAQVGHRFYQAPDRPWFRSKRRPSFADMLATLKRESLRARFLREVPSGRVRRNMEQLVELATLPAA
jgi:DDE superfamily endonuclease